MQHNQQHSSRKRPLRHKPIALMVKASLFGIGLAHASAHAATLIVTSNSDNGSGGCTLREALNSVNAGAAMGGCVDILPPPQPPLTSNFGINDTVIIGNTLASDTITLNGSALDVTRAVTVNGYEGFTISGDPDSSVISVQDTAFALNNTIITGGATGIVADSSNVRLNNCLISNNGIFFGSGAGGISSLDGSLTIENSSITNNSASVGGLISSGSRVTIVDSNIDNNSGYNIGGISAFDGAPLTIINSSVSGNSSLMGTGGINTSNKNLILTNTTIANNVSSNSGAGGIRVRGATLTLNDSTVSNNRTSAGVDGGGISLRYDAILEGANSTISGNTSGGSGGGIRADGSAYTVTIDIRNFTLEGNKTGSSGGGGISAINANVRLRNTTVANSQADAALGAGLNLTNSALRLDNSIIANSNGGGECLVNGGSIITDSATIVQDGSCNSQRAIDPQLGPLADNGGSTLTMALKPNSPARNTGILASCEVRDQRGQLRDNGDGACDVGAIEFNQNDDFGEQNSFFVIPLKNNKAVVVPL